MSVHRSVRLAIAGATLVITAGCTNPVGADRVPPADPTQVEYAASLNIDLSRFTRTATGLYVQEVTVGGGTPLVANDSVAVGYTGWLPNGVQFDTNQPNGTPLRFRVGTGAVIAGFDEGMLGMRVGGTRRLVIPSELAYGRAGSPPTIPPNAVLVFQVTLAQRY